ncbi:MAG: PAAR domain-containing protein [Burkholderiaceae bacterium]
MFNPSQSAAIRLGDSTSHGGTVISATTLYVLHGIAVAQEGDMTQCPKCKGVFPILPTPGSSISHGKTVAFEGTKTACGASLIASFKG